MDVLVSHYSWVATERDLIPVIVVSEPPFTTTTPDHSIFHVSHLVEGHNVVLMHAGQNGHTVIVMTGCCPLKECAQPQRLQVSVILASIQSHSNRPLLFFMHHFSPISPMCYPLGKIYLSLDSSHLQGEWQLDQRRPRTWFYCYDERQLLSNRCWSSGLFSHFHSKIYPHIATCTMCMGGERSIYQQL